MEAEQARILIKGDRVRLGGVPPVDGTVERLTNEGCFIWWDDRKFNADFHPFGGLAAVDLINKFKCERDRCLSPLACGTFGYCRVLNFGDGLTETRAQLDELAQQAEGSHRQHIGETEA